jgi:hypothetical protein
MCSRNLSFRRSSQAAAAQTTQTTEARLNASGAPNRAAAHTVCGKCCQCEASPSGTYGIKCGCFAASLTPFQSFLRFTLALLDQRGAGAKNSWGGKKQFARFRLKFVGDDACENRCKATQHEP